MRIEDFYEGRIIHEKFKYKDHEIDTVIVRKLKAKKCVCRLEYKGRYVCNRYYRIILFEGRMLISVSGIPYQVGMYVED